MNAQINSSELVKVGGEICISQGYIHVRSVIHQFLDIGWHTQ